MSFNNIVQRFAITLALLTSLGILVHDTKFDKAVALFVAVPAAFASLSGIPKLASDGHNHIERVSIESGMRGLQNGMPRIQPRDDNKKFGLPKHVAKGVHAFDGYYVPLD